MNVAVKAITLPSDQDHTGRTLGEQEITNVAEAIKSGTLTSTKGTFVKQFEARFKEELGVKHAYACSSGTAAIHCAVAAVNPEPGDEIITTPITDMGGLTPILYQGAIPVFADVDPKTCNVTADTIKARISERTKAICVTHLFGNPCDMEDIMALARAHDIPVIEDCAQAFMATANGKPVGVVGDIGCFSLQQGKHITTGEGGVVVSNNEKYARHMYLYINKAWGYGDPNPDHYFMALNYRMSELQGAVALAQFDKLEDSVNNRINAANRMSEKLAGIEGISTPKASEGNVHTFWKYCLNVDNNIIPGGAVALGGALRDYHVASAPRYIQKPAFKCQVIKDQVTLGNSRWPFNHAAPEAVDYRDELFPGTYKGLEEILVLPINERYTDEHVDYVAESIIDAVARLKEAK